MFHLDTPPASDANLSDAPAHRESLASFIEFAASALHLAHTAGDGLVELAFDNQQHAKWPKPYRVKVAIGAGASENGAKRLLGAQEGLDWLWNLASREPGAFVGRPAAQPEAVHEFSQRLFEAYHVEGGQTHLAGCRMVEVPFVRLTTLAVDDPTEVEHRYYTTDGQPTSDAQLQELGLLDVRQFESQPSHLSQTQVEALVQQAGQISSDWKAVTLVVAKRAEGAIQFDIGEQCARVTFSDWTQTLAAPPFHCAASGLDTHHLAAIDDGRIVAAEAIGICEESAARVLSDEMVTCEATGRRVDPRLIEKCPVTDAQVLRSEMVTCVACQQLVSHQALQKGVCKACRELPAVKSTDTWVTGLLEQYPALKAYRKYRVGKVGGFVHVMAIGFWRRVLIVVPDQSAATVAPSSVAVREGLAGAWRVAPPNEWSKLLGTPEES